MTKEAIAKTMEPKLDAFENGAASFSQFIDNGAVSLGNRLKARFRRKTIVAESNTANMLGDEKDKGERAGSGNDKPLDQIKEEKDDKEKDILSEDQENA